MEGIEALAAQLLQRVVLGVAQLVAADQAGGAVAIGGDAVEGEPCPPSAAQDSPGRVLRWGGAGCCLANQRPSSSRSMRGWPMGLMRMRSAMYSRRRW